MADKQECAILGCSTVVLDTCRICGGMLTKTRHKQYQSITGHEGFSHLSRHEEYSKNCTYPPEHQFESIELGVAASPEAKHGGEAAK